MRIARRPKLPNSQTAEDRALWKTIRAELSERRRRKRLKYGLRLNREADLYLPAVMRHAAENNLGFGFYPMNIKILKLCGLGKNKKTKHYASSYGLMLGEEKTALEVLNIPVEFAVSVYKCLDALRYFPVLVST